MSFGKRIKKIFQKNSSDDGVDEIVSKAMEEIESKSGNRDRAASAPGWALVLRSPFAESQHSSSWLGGAPSAPSGFQWPVGDDQVPLHFMAQIDLGAVKAVEGCARPSGLPEKGALLFFVGETYAVRFLNEDEVDCSQPVSPPANLPPIEDQGYLGGGNAFNQWPVDLVGYVDTDGERPECLPNRFTRAVDWITTWGVAALDAEIIIKELERELRFGQESKERDAQLKGSKFLKSKLDHMIKRDEHFALMADQAPQLISVLKEWHQLTLSKPASDPVDKDALEKVFQARLALRDQMSGSQNSGYAPKFVLPGNHLKVWDQLVHHYKCLTGDGGFGDLPNEYRAFAEIVISDWRGHRFLGAEQAPPYNYEDLDGLDCMIRVGADQLLGTDSEHEHAMSIWCLREQMINGHYDKGKFLRHSNG